MKVGKIDMWTIKLYTRAFLIFLTVASQAFAQQPSLDAKGLYRQIRFLDSLIQMESEARIRKGDFQFLPGGETFNKKLAVSKDLDALVKSRDPSALFYSGLLKSEFADRISSSVDRSANALGLASEEYSGALSLFKMAGDSGVISGYWNVAVQYEKGQGVIASPLAASEWYYKAAQAYLREGDRERAIAALEAIKRLTKDSPLSIRLETALKKGEPK
jgi:TPR repeat protein